MGDMVGMLGLGPLSTSATQSVVTTYAGLPPIGRLLMENDDAEPYITVLLNSIMGVSYVNLPFPLPIFI